MKTPSNSFDDADLAIYRAHGDAVFEHYPMPTFTADEVSRFGAAMAYRSAVNAFERGVHMPSDLPLPPSYWDDLEEMWPAGSETQAPSKPAAPLPQAQTFNVGDRIMIRDGVKRGLYYGAGDTGTVVEVGSNCYPSVWFDEGCVWLVDLHEAIRIEADEKPQAQPEQDGYMVCTKAHGFAEWQVGEIRPRNTASYSTR